MTTGTISVVAISPTPSEAATSAGYTFTYSGATTYSCSHRKLSYLLRANGLHQVVVS